MNSEELKKLYQDGERNFSGANLRRANFANCNLSNINLSNANLRFTNFNDADLSYSNLSGANLSKSSLKGANLQNANLSNSNLQEAYLISANLSNADLRDADLAEAELIDANFSGVDLSETENAVTIAHISPVEKNNPNIELLDSLKKASSDISLSSEGSYPYEFFIWDQTEHGIFLIEELVEIVGHKTTEIYENIYVPDQIDIDYESYTSIAKQFKIDEKYYELFCDPKTLAEREFYANHEDFDYFFNGIHENPAGVRWEDYIKYKAFADIVTDNLTNITMYRVGEIQVHIYLIGEAKNGDLIGIHSISIET